MRLQSDKYDERERNSATRSEHIFLSSHNAVNDELELWPVEPREQVPTTEYYLKQYYVHTMYCTYMTSYVQKKKKILFVIVRLGQAV